MRPALICITGVDGCGKTTLLRGLCERLEHEDLKVDLVWSRFNNYLSKPLLAFTRLTGHNRRFAIDGVPFGTHDFERLPVYRELFTLTQAFDVNLATKHRLRHALRRPNDLVILERGPWDTLVDVISDTGLFDLPESKVGRWMVSRVASAPVVLIRRPVPSILESRPELRHDSKLVLRAEQYDRLATQRGWRIVNNQTTIDSAVDMLYSAVRNEVLPNK